MVLDWKQWGMIGVVGLTLASLPLPGRAAFERTYAGCFERAALAGTVTVLTKAPVCQFTLTNSGAQPETETVSVINVDPGTAVVTDSDGESVDPSRTDSSVDFSVTLNPGDSESYTVSPLNYTGEESDFWFAAFGDPQNQYGYELSNPVFVEIMDQLDLVNPAFLIVAGDIIRGSTTSSTVQLTEYAAHDEVFQSFRGMAFPVPGDHDGRQDPATHYSSFYGDRDFTFTYGNTRVIGLSTTESLATEGTLSAEQLAWLEQTLDSNSSSHTIVYWHHPIIPPSWSGTQGIVGDDHRLELAQILVDGGVELLITGEAHGYDYHYVDGSDLPGLTGGFYQLVTGGGGGKMTGYSDTDHFFVLVHVTDSGIEHQLMDYSEFDLRVRSDQANDGSEEAVTLTLDNAGNATVPYVRPRFLLKDRDKIYVSRDDGQFLPFASETVDGARRGTVATSIEPDQVITLEARQRVLIHSNIANQVHRKGRITFATLPDPDDHETGLQVRKADRKVTIAVSGWDPANEDRRWTASTRPGAITRYQVTDLTPNREYLVVRDGKPRRRIASDTEGVARFRAKSRDRQQELALQREPKRIPEVAVLPAAGAGPNLRRFDHAGTVLNSFFTYDQALRHGYAAQWVDLDGNGAPAVATVPAPGQTSHLRVFERSGKAIASVFPFGEDFRGGLEVTALDIDADGDQELAVSPAGDHAPQLKLYDWRGSRLERIDTSKAFGGQATAGLTLASGDLNGDGDDELLVARKDGSAVRVFRWRPQRAALERWFGTAVLTGELAGSGLEIAAGDLDFDGKDEIAIASLTKPGPVTHYNFNAASRNLQAKASLEPFAAGQAAGLDLAVGEWNGRGRAELFATPRGGAAAGQLAVLTFQPGAGTFRQATSVTTPIAEPLTLALADSDGDWKDEVFIAGKTAGNQVLVWEKRRSGLKQIGQFSVYAAGFANGLSLATNN
jgi:3',5'-cyclic AMP phosphodiesterase CpdA